MDGPRGLNHSLSASDLSGNRISLDIIQATTPSEIDAAVRAMNAAAASDSRAGAAVTITALTVDNQPVPSTSLQLAQRVAENTPIEPDELTPPKPPAETGVELEQRRHRERWNAIFVKARVIGVTGLVTSAIIVSAQAIGTPVEPIYAFLSGGVVAGAMSGGLQKFATPFGRWLVSWGLLKTDGGAPGWVTFAKLLAVTATYLGVLELGAHATGLPTIPDWRSLAIATYYGSAIEYFWDRFVGLSREHRQRTDPKNFWWHEHIADRRFVTLSLIGTTAYVLASKGLFIGEVATYGLGLTGVAALYYQFRDRITHRGRMFDYAIIGTVVYQGCHAILRSLAPLFGG